MAATMLPEKRNREREQLRLQRLALVLRMLAGGVALVTAVFGLARQHYADHPAALEAPLMRRVVYGDPSRAAVKPVSGPTTTPRTVCTAELRRSPTHGPWVCLSSQAIDTEAVGRKAVDPGGSCTARVVRPADLSWTCETTSSPPARWLDVAWRQRHPLFFADLTQKRTGHDTAAPEVCTQEMRADARHGNWQCSTWQQLDGRARERLVQPLDPGGPCTWRVIDEFTGVWTCQSRAPMQLP